MSRLFQLKHFLHYLLFANDEHQIHSPFVFNLYLSVIKKKEGNVLFNEIEKTRKSLLRKREKILVKDFGSGSLADNNAVREIRTIARNSLKKARYGRLLYRLVKFMNPETAIELGTSLGITTLYQALPINSKCQFYSFEGCPKLSKLAQINFQSFSTQINVVEGNIDDTLPKVMEQLKEIDYVFFDANHRYNPTMNYFNLCIKKAHPNSLFVFDDIHRSAEMNKAWQEIKRHEKVRITIDLNEIGLVFFRQNQPKQNYLLRF